mgnify:CR=1 FL=1
MRSFTTVCHKLILTEIHHKNLLSSSENQLHLRSCTVTVLKRWLAFFTLFSSSTYHTDDTIRSYLLSTNMSFQLVPSKIWPPGRPSTGRVLYPILAGAATPEGATAASSPANSPLSSSSSLSSTPPVLVPGPEPPRIAVELRAFCADADADLKQLRSDCAEMEAGCRGMLRYFGQAVPARARASAEQGREGEASAEIGRAHV